MVAWDDLPLEIKEKMLEEQVKQGNKRDVTVFENNICGGGLSGGGFSWCNTIDEYSFWEKIVHGADFVEFYDRYPKRILSVMENKERKIIHNNTINNGDMEFLEIKPKEERTGIGEISNNTVKIIFNEKRKDIGELFFQDGVLTFNGDATESAKLFISEVNRLFK